MNRLVHVAVREYLENVRTKAFLIAVFLTPLLLVGSFLVPKLLEGRRPEARRLAVVDVTGRLGDDVARRLGEHRIPGTAEPLYLVERVAAEGPDPAAREAALPATRRALDARVLSGELFAYLVVRRSAFERGKDQPASEYRTGNLFDVKVIEQVRSDLADAVNAQIVAEGGIPPAAAAVLTAKPPLDPSDVRASGRAASLTTTVLPFVFTLLLFLTIMTTSQALITSTLEEKANRVIEVLLSSVSPQQLMVGKVLGTCAVGLTLMAIYAVAGLGGLAMNGLPLVSGGQLLLCLVFYLLGFLFFASVMVAVGSVCNTLKEAQVLLAPVMTLLSLSMLFLVAVAREPHGDLSRVLSFVPLFTPFLMMVRIAASPPCPPLEIAAAAGVLALAAWWTMRAAGRVFRVGVLMYGKPPSLRELFRWLRAR